MNRSTLVVNGLGLQPRAAVASSWFTAETPKSPWASPYPDECPRQNIQAVGADGHASSRARSKRATSLCACCALDGAARGGSTAALGASFKRRGCVEHPLLHRSADRRAAYTYHGVAEHEVEDVLARPGEDRPGTEGARIAVGQTSAGRYLRVIYVPEVGGVFVITAYELTGKPLLAYRRRKRRKR